MAADKPQVCLTPNEQRRVDEATAILRQLFRLYGDQLGDFRPDPPPDGLGRLLRGTTLGELQGALVQVLAALQAAKKREA